MDPISSGRCTFDVEILRKRLTRAGGVWCCPRAATFSLFTMSKIEAKKTELLM